VQYVPLCFSTLYRWDAIQGKKRNIKILKRAKQMKELLPLTSSWDMALQQSSVKCHTLMWAQHNMGSCYACR
jgi:hypothetical protein